MIRAGILYSVDMWVSVVWRWTRLGSKIGAELQDQEEVNTLEWLCVPY